MVVILVEEEKMREMLVVVVGVVDRSPSPTLPKGREPILAVFLAVGWNALPWGGLGRGFREVGEGPLSLGNSVGVAIS